MSFFKFLFLLITGLISSIILIYLVIFFVLFIISWTLIDMILYPFDKDKKNNKFHKLLTFLFVEYPPFLREKKFFWRLIALPFILIYIMIKK